MNPEIPTIPPMLAALTISQRDEILATIAALERQPPGPISSKGEARQSNESRIYREGWNAALQAVARVLGDRS